MHCPTYKYNSGLTLVDILW